MRHLKTWQALCLLFCWLCLTGTASAQLEFTAKIESIERPARGEATLQVRLTPSVTIPVRATASTEVEDRNGAAIRTDDLRVGQMVKIEGIFTNTGLLAREIEVTDAAEAFELRGELTDIDPAARTLSLLGLVLPVAPDAEIKDTAGKPVNLSELRLGQSVKVEGNSTSTGFQATEIRVTAPAQFAGIRFQGTVTQASAKRLQVELPGDNPVLVEMDDSTVRKGGVAKGATVEVRGTLTPRLSVHASQIDSLQPFVLVPDEIHLDFNQTGRVDLVARTPAASNLVFTLESLNPSVAAPQSSMLVLAEGMLTTSFQVDSFSTEGRAVVQVTAPTEAGGATFNLDVEVETAGPDDFPGDDNLDDPENELLEIKFSPSKIEDGPAGEREVRLVLNQPAPVEIMVPLSLKEGRPGEVLFPASVTIAQGDTSAPVLLDIQPNAGRTKIRATLPLDLGGDTGTIDIELRPQAEARRDIRWLPDDVELLPGGTALVELRLDAPAPFEFQAVISVKDGDPAILEPVPTQVLFPAGVRSVMLPIVSTGEEGRVRFEAALPIELGGDDDTLKVEVEQ